MKLLRKCKKLLVNWAGEDFKRHDLHTAILVPFTVTAVAITLFMGISVYERCMVQTKNILREENQQMVTQASYQLTAHLRNMMKISDALYYGVIREMDMETESFFDGFHLLYDTNKENIERIALFSETGELIEAVPAAKRKEQNQIMEQDWYYPTLAREQDITFGIPKVERLFESATGGYTRIIPMTRMVLMNRGGELEKGLLLVQLKESSMSDILSDVLLSGGSYLYMIDERGRIVYHAERQLVQSGYISIPEIAEEELMENTFTESYPDKEYFIKTVGYTGWKLVGVLKEQALTLNTVKNGMLVAFLILLFLSVMIVINLYLSRKLSAPMQRLEEAVNQIESGNLDMHIEPSGFHEVWHLGRAIGNMQSRLKQLMADIVVENEAKRRSELMVLQNQINPHFLYNTLDIIVWMIENEKREEAVDVVTALARFFRISLSKGKTIVSVADEAEHVRNYLKIQGMRFKNRFTYSIFIEEGVEQYATMKLILQPIVENCIYHAMEFMDGDGEIHISVKKEEKDIVFLVEDNGCGMTEDTVEKIMAGKSVSKGKGGVGLVNVQERLRLVFGEGYGMTVCSELDEGTQVWVRIPAMQIEELEARGLK